MILTIVQYALKIQAFIAIGFIKAMESLEYHRRVLGVNHPECSPDPVVGDTGLERVFYGYYRRVA